MSQPKTDVEIVDAYLRHFSEGDDSLFWAWEEVQNYLSSNPDRALRLTLQLIASAQTSEVLSYVAAGTLEDLLYARGEQYIDEVERLARQNPKFRQAMRSVYNESESPGDAHDRVIKAVTATSN